MIRRTNTLRYDYSGRKRRRSKPKGETFQKFKTPEFRPLEVATDQFRRGSGTEYKSVPIDSCKVEKREEPYKQEVSKNYTVAPAYNKGGYMVVSKENIKDIGR